MGTEHRRLSANRQRHHFEIRVNGELAGFSEYHHFADAFAILHTEIRHPHQRQGLAKQLAQFALDTARPLPSVRCGDARR